MAEYHVGCGLAGIYAGTLKKSGIEWQNKTLVTDEAVDAVRDYLMLQLKQGEHCTGFEWKTKDGRSIKLMLSVKKSIDISAKNGNNNV